MKISTASIEDLFKEWPADWPDKNYFVNPLNVTKKQYVTFKNLIAKEPSEAEIESF